MMRYYQAITNGCVQLDATGVVQEQRDCDMWFKHLANIMIVKVICFNYSLLLRYKKNNEKRQEKN